MFKTINQLSLRGTITHIVEEDFTTNDETEEIGWMEIVQKCLAGQREQMLSRIPEISMSESGSIVEPETGRDTDFSRNFNENILLDVPLNVSTSSSSSKKKKSLTTVIEKLPDSPFAVPAAVPPKSPLNPSANPSPTQSLHPSPPLSPHSSYSSPYSSPYSLKNSPLSSPQQPLNSPHLSPQLSPQSSSQKQLSFSSPQHSPAKSILNSTHNSARDSTHNSTRNSRKSIRNSTRNSTRNFIHDSIQGSIHNSTCNSPSRDASIAQNSPQPLQAPEISPPRSTSGSTRRSSRNSVPAVSSPLSPSPANSQLNLPVNPLPQSRPTFESKWPRSLKGRRLQKWRGEHPIYKPLENGCYEFVEATKPYSPIQKKRKLTKRKSKKQAKENDPMENVKLSESYIARSETVKEKFSKIFLEKDGLNWKPTKASEKISMATFIKSKENNQVVGYMRFDGKCSKPHQKTGDYLTLLVVLKGKVSIQIENEAPVVVDPLNPVIVPATTLYSVENLIDDETLALFSIL